jgi:serine/threonine protein phosphatase PrpC
MLTSGVGTGISLAGLATTMALRIGTKYFFSAVKVVAASPWTYLNPKSINVLIQTAQQLKPILTKWNAVAWQFYSNVPYKTGPVIKMIMHGALKLSLEARNESLFQARFHRKRTTVEESLTSMKKQNECADKQLENEVKKRATTFINIFEHNYKISNLPEDLQQPEYLKINGTNVGVCSTVGISREKNEDRYLVDRITSKHCTGTLYAVYDGHGGEDCSDFLRINFSAFFEQALAHEMRLRPNIAGLQNAFTKAFLDLDHIYTERVDGEAGSTATVVFIPDKPVPPFARKTVFVANAGDSRALIVKKDGTAKRLSADADAFEPEFAKSVIRIGGEEVIKEGRVHSPNGIDIEVTRAIGDRDVTSKEGKRLLTPRPKVTYHELQPEDEYVVVASDGLFKVAESHAVAKAIQFVVSRGKTLNNVAMYLAGKALISEDNITALVAELPKVKNATLD